MMRRRGGPKRPDARTTSEGWGGDDRGEDKNNQVQGQMLIIPAANDGAQVMEEGMISIIQAQEQ